MRSVASHRSNIPSSARSASGGSNSGGNNTSSSSRVAHLQLPPAEQPDIVRAAQKDDFYKRLFSDQCYDLVGRIAGARYGMQHQRTVRLLADTVYYSLNSFLGPVQTLGEEYCDILMVQPHGQVQVPPGVGTRVLLVGWHVLVPYALGRLAERVSPYLVSVGVGAGVASLFPRLLASLRALAPKLQRFHLALFYFDGKFYDFSKRLSNIQYVFNGKLDQRRPKYHILGALILIQFAVSLLIYMREKFGILRKLNLQIEDLSEQNLQEADDNRGQQNNPNKCTLCLEPRTNTTATLCGHLFCWDCITEWCNNKAECPLCRRPLTLQSLVCVYHYQ